METWFKVLLGIGGIIIIFLLIGYFKAKKEESQPLSSQLQGGVNKNGSN